jgi:hypothetical protein
VWRSWSAQAASSSATAEKLAAEFTEVGVDRSESGLKELPHGTRSEMGDATDHRPVASPPYAEASRL